MHHPTQPLWILAKQLPVRFQAADDVLRQLRPVHSYDHPPVTDQVPQLGFASSDIRPGRTVHQRAAVDPERVDAELHGAATVCDPRLARGLVHVDVDVRSERRLRASQERLRPPGGEKTEPVRPEHAFHDRAGDIVGQHPEVLRRRPRCVAEVGDPQVRTQRPELGGCERQMVVLDQHGGAGCGLPCQCIGEHRVVALVGLPIPLERGAEGRLRRRRVEKVQDEPQRTVGNRVVRPFEHDPVHVEHADGRAAGIVTGQVKAAVRRRPGGAPVGFAQRRTHPDQPATGGDTIGGTTRGLPRDHVQTADQPATTAAHRQRPVIVRGEGDRPTIGRDKHTGRPCGHRTDKVVAPLDMTHRRRLEPALLIVTRCGSEDAGQTAADRTVGSAERTALAHPVPSVAFSTTTLS